jgi:hypothetical protein
MASSVVWTWVELTGELRLEKAREMVAVSLSPGMRMVARPEPAEEMPGTGRR